MLLGVSSGQNGLKTVFNEICSHVFKHIVSSWWCCRRKLWNLQAVEPCWRKHTTGSAWVVIASLYLLFSLHSYVWMELWSATFLFLPPCLPIPVRLSPPWGTPSLWNHKLGLMFYLNKPFLPYADFGHGILSQQKKSNSYTGCHSPFTLIPVLPSKTWIWSAIHRLVLWMLAPP